MAAFALLSELTPVNVFIIMATDACTRNDDFVIHRIFVASIAVRYVMPAIKLEFCALVMIEVPCFP
jgi:hypothetical protein